LTPVQFDVGNNQVMTLYFFPW